MATPSEGTCQICGGRYRLRAGVVPEHGHRRPGAGRVVGKCFGARHPPAELDCERLRAWALELQLREARLHELCRQIEASRVEQVMTPAGEAIAYADARFPAAAAQRLELSRAAAERLRTEFLEVEQRLRQWRPRSVRRVPAKKRKGV